MVPEKQKSSIDTLEYWTLTTMAVILIGIIGVVSYSFLKTQQESSRRLELNTLLNSSGYSYNKELRNSLANMDPKDALHILHSASRIIQERKASMKSPEVAGHSDSAYHNESPVNSTMESNTK